eukprot:968765-Rhodomonas_salina.1
MHTSDSSPARERVTVWCAMGTRKGKVLMESGFQSSTEHSSSASLKSDTKSESYSDAAPAAKSDSSPVRPSSDSRLRARSTATSCFFFWAEYHS